MISQPYSLFVYLRWHADDDAYVTCFFLLTIISQLGYTASATQLLTIPIYATAAVVSVLVCCGLDKAAKSGRSRWPYVFGSICAILIGFIMALRR
jgi:hypothetical protein